jgi:biopolymer transport protein ExbD
MNRNPREQKLVADINITPFTDVILVLLVIFMITTPLISQLNIKVNLPEAKSGVSQEGARQVRADIAITREGLFYLDNKLVTRKELEEQIKIMHSYNPTLTVNVHSDKFVIFQKIVDVLDILTEAGITKLNIAARAEEQ